MGVYGVRTETQVSGLKKRNGFLRYSSSSSSKSSGASMHQVGCPALRGGCTVLYLALLTTPRFVNPSAISVVNPPHATRTLSDLTAVILLRPIEPPSAHFPCWYDKG